MTPYVKSKASDLIPATVKTVQYDGKYWGMPNETNAPLLYYRTDQVKSAPKTWQDVYAQAKSNDGIVYQGAPYEGLTCDFLDIATAAGGSVLSPDGKKATIDSPQNLKALQFMVDGVKQGLAARGVTTYMEEESRRYWESGRATFMRNWPYAYALGEKAPKIKGKFAVAPFPDRKSTRLNSSHANISYAVFCLKKKKKTKQKLTNKHTKKSTCTLISIERSREIYLHTLRDRGIQI